MAEVCGVVVVGAGPAGLLVAGDLAAAGVRTVVLERRTGKSDLTRAFAVHARTLEQLDARDLADRLVERGQQIRRLRLFGEARLDLSGLPTRFPYVLVTPQYETKRLLAERAREAGAEIVRGVEVAGLEQDADGVTVRMRDGAERRARYVVGADGVRSTVRSALGVPFPGRSIGQSVMLADVRLTDALPDVLSVNSTAVGFAFVVPFGDGWYRVIAFRHGERAPDDAPVDLAEIREVTRGALGSDFGMHDPRWLSRFHNDERQVPSYRVGRVFLAGDAAHVHSPAGGLGMNAGLQDAANLGWKLAAVLAGHSGDQLLDSYHQERYPVGKLVLRLSGGLLRAAMVRAAPLRAGRTVLTAVASRLRPAADVIARQVSGLAIAYPAGPGAHRAVGRRVPDLALAGSGRLYEALRHGRFVLLGAGAPPAEAAAWADRVDTATAPVTSPRLTLVRPDGYAAWASDTMGDTALPIALARWCGQPLSGQRVSSR